MEVRGGGRVKMGNIGEERGKLLGKGGGWEWVCGGLGTTGVGWYHFCVIMNFFGSARARF